MTIRKMICALLTLTLVFSSAAFAELTLSAGGETPICSETVALTIAIPDDVYVEDYETNLQTLLLEEQGNYDLTFIVLPSTDYISKLNLMVQSGDTLPDVIFGYEYTYPSNAMVYSWAQAGAIVPLTEYITNPDIAYYFTQACERTGLDMISMMTMPDGEVYSLPSMNQSYANASRCKYFVYTPWMEELGLEAPETTEELYEFLKAIQGVDMNGNGKADEMGIVSGYGAILPMLMSSFVYAGGENYVTVDDGEVGFAYTTDAWKEGLHYIRKLYAEGLIPMESLTMDADLYSSLLNQEDVVAFMFIASWLGDLAGENPAINEYGFFTPVKGPEGVAFTKYDPGVPKATFFVTADCKYPEAAFRLGDLLLSREHSIITRWGEKGVDWDYYDDIEDKDKYVSLYGNFDVSIVTYNDSFFTEAQNKSLRQNAPFIREFAIAAGIGKVEDNITGRNRTEAASQTAYNTGEYWPDEVIPVLIYTEDELARINDKLMALTDRVNEITAAFFAGNLDIDAEWDAFQKELKDIGIDEVTEVIQGVYDRMYK